jgi:hypothetical protein
MVCINRVVSCNNQNTMPLATKEKPHQPKARKDPYSKTAKPNTTAMFRQFMALILTYVTASEFDKHIPNHRKQYGQAQHTLIVVNARLAWRSFAPGQPV